MTLIALEEHMLPADLVDQVWPTPKGPEALTAKLVDFDEQRLRVMDDAGIDMQVLSVTAPGSPQVPTEAAAERSRAVNDRCAEAIAAHPDRFNALATLPTQDPGAAIVEAKRAIAELGFCGVIINGHTQGRFLDAPEFDELLTAIEELDVPVYLHPTYPPQQVAEVYFRGLPGSTGRALATAAWGWHAETGLHVLRLAAAGVFARHPELQIVVGHMGENLPFSLMRADTVLRRADPGAPSVADVVREHVHITICGYTTTPPLLCALQVFGADRIMVLYRLPLRRPSGAFQVPGRGTDQPGRPGQDRTLQREAAVSALNTSARDGRKASMSPVEIDPESPCRIPLIRREELDADGQKAFDFYTSGTMRGLHGPAGIWLHSPKLAELYRPLGTYLRSGAGLSEPVREVCILATAREFNNAFEWAAHEPEALRVGVPPEIIQCIKLRKPTDELVAPFGTVVELMREAFTAGSVSVETYDAAVSLLGVPLLIDLMSLAGMYASTAALLTVFDMQLDPGETHLLPSLE